MGLDQYMMLLPQTEAESLRGVEEDLLWDTKKTQGESKAMGVAGGGEEGEK